MNNLVQIRNPWTDRFVKIDRLVGRVVSCKKTPGPYKNVPIAKKKQNVT